MVNAELEGMVSEAVAASRGEQKEEDLREQFKPKAEKSVRASILLDLIGEKEGVSVSDDEMKEEILSLAQRFQVTPENIMKYHVARDGSLDKFRRGLYEKKVLKNLLAGATVTQGDQA
jgi:trigger factor